MTEGKLTPRGSRPLRSGDRWVHGPDGQKYWGAFGAAGLMLVQGRPELREVLLQHRAVWSHHGGTWGLPGGALDEGEDAVTAALREAAEEAGVPADGVRVLSQSALDLGFWSYTTVIAERTRDFPVAVSDVESIALRWVPLDTVHELPLHPGLAARLPELLRLLAEQS